MVRMLVPASTRASGIAPNVRAGRANCTRSRDRALNTYLRHIYSRAAAAASGASILSDRFCGSAALRRLVMGSWRKRQKTLKNDVFRIVAGRNASHIFALFQLPTD
jgi:hypothetical protein